MLPGMTPVLSSEPRSLVDIISKLGLTSGLQLCLDAGDATSYPGSGQLWIDLSGNGYDFYRGTSSSSEGNDPTFNGSAGGLSANEYWSFDGGDYFTLAQANPTWVNNIPKDNAKLTIMVWAYLPAIASVGFAGTQGNLPSNVGFLFGQSGTGFEAYTVSSDTSGVNNSFTGPSLVRSAWSFTCVSIDESAGAGIWGVDATQTPFDATYVNTPATANSTYTMQIGTRGNGTVPLQNGSRMAEFAAWEGVALTSSQISDLYNLTRRRFA